MNTPSRSCRTPTATSSASASAASSENIRGTLPINMPMVPTAISTMALSPVVTTISKATPSPSHLDTSSSQEPPAAKPTLLVCDDEEGPRQSLRIVFKNDYNVLVAASGIEALSL